MTGLTPNQAKVFRADADQVSRGAPAFALIPVEIPCRRYSQGDALGGESPWNTRVRRWLRGAA